MSRNSDTITISDVEVTTDVEVSLDDITGQVDVKALLDAYDDQAGTLEWLTDNMDAETLLSELCNDNAITEAIAKLVKEEPESFGINLIDTVLNFPVEDIVAQMEPETMTLFAAACGGAQVPVEITSKPITDGVTVFTIDDKTRGVMVRVTGKVAVRYAVEPGAEVQCFTAETEAQAVNIFNAIMNWNRDTEVKS